ncbi:MAG: TraR/DksA family transcriptional regulator [Puniceicoccaceae bacterium 5H]|nr:MAG: TraR/DksA family transcriptional regulator [Puniceicoccaceae bacterium 5H]
MPAKKAAKKTTKKTASKSAANEQTASKVAASKAVDEAAATASDETSGEVKSTKTSAGSVVRRKNRNTPAIFKVPARKSTPVMFTLEDVREVLSKRKSAKPEAGDSPDVAPDKVSKAPAATASSATPAPTQPVEEETPAQATKRNAASLADILGFGIGGGGGSSSPATPVKTTPKGERKVPEKWVKYHKLLVELRDSVRDELNEHSSDTLKRSQKEDTGDLATSADSGSDNFDREFALSLLSTEQEALKEIEAAIERIYNGTYGVCEITGQPIAEERLEAVPFTRFSLEGQRQFESTARRRVQRAGAFLNEGSADNVSFGDDDNES